MCSDRTCASRCVVIGRVQVGVLDRTCASQCVG